MFDQSVHDTIKRKNKIFAVTVSALALVFTVLRMILTRFSIDPYIHFYIDASNIFALSVDYIIAACVVIIYFISVFIYKHKRESHKYTEISDCFVQGTQAQVFSASLTGFLFGFSSAFQAYAFMITPSEPVGLTFAERVFAYMTSFPFDFALFFISGLSAVYFFKTAALNFDIGENIEQYKKIEQSENEKNLLGHALETAVKTAQMLQPAYMSADDNTQGKKPEGRQKFSSAHIIFSFMPIVWAFLHVFRCFFDMSKSVNSPVRIYELMSFLALSAYFVAESRMLVERREVSRFFTYSYIAVMLTAVSSLPNLIWSSFWMLQTNNAQIIYAAEISLVIYIMSRVYSQIRYGRFLLQR